MNVFEKITAQQGPQGTDKWMIGEQLQDILRQEPELVPIVEEDLETLTLGECAKAMKAKADELRKELVSGRCVCIPPDVAEGVIRKFFGLPEAGSREPEKQAKEEPAGMLNLEDFF